MTAVTAVMMEASASAIGGERALLMCLQGEAPLGDGQEEQRGLGYSGEMLRSSLPANPPRPDCGGGPLLQDRLQGTNIPPKK